MDETQARAILKTFDTASGRADTVAAVPLYPFAGELSVRVAPDRDRLAIMATTAMIPPAAGRPITRLDDGWLVERRLGFVDLGGNKALRWAAMPAEARYPLDLLDWSPDGGRVALRARRGPADPSAPLYAASADGLAVERVGPEIASVGDASTNTSFPRDSASIWLDGRRLLVRATRGADGRAGWWLAEAGGRATPLPGGEAHPLSAFHRLATGELVGIAGERLVRLDPSTGTLVPVAGAPLPAGARILQQEGALGPAGPIVVAERGAAGVQTLRLLPLAPGAAATRPLTLPAGAEILHVDAARATVIWREPTRRGLFLREASLAGGRKRDLLALNGHLANVSWGETRLIDYRIADGRALKGAVILPPGYRAGRRYPVVTWVYGGHQVSGLDDYWLDPSMPGLYNLQLYAARGYVVLVPSIPLERSGRNTHLTELTKSVLPAVDRLVELGIADGARVGVMGQSYGGFAVMGLATQTDRFKAGVALAGMSDLTAFHYAFDPTARFYPGIEHEKSSNPAIAEAGNAGLAVPPYEDRWLYWRGSPLSHADRIETPLLIAHGEFDVRGSLAQSEALFAALHRQGKTARLLRYWGENHALATSPANVRSVLAEALAWFDKYLAKPAAAPPRPAD
ncbi:MAG TPA: prolyl oligopeptidase family serine peptidase, partial [Allosphingosinicella sp.]